MLRIFVFLLLVHVSHQAFYLKLTRVDTVSNPRYLRLDVRINNATKDNTVDVHVNLLKTLNGTLSIILGFYQETADGRLKKAFTLPKQNYCTLLRYSNNIPFIRDFLEQVSKYGTIPMSCPIVRGYYYVKNCTFTGMSALPPTIVSGNYQVRFKVIDANGKRPILALRFRAFLTIEID